MASRAAKRGGKIVRDTLFSCPTEPAVGTTITEQAATQDAPFSFAFAAGAFTGPGDYTATKGDNTPLPAWLTFTPATRTLAGTPLVGDIGTLAVKIKKDDHLGNVVSQTFNIVVSGA